MDDPYGPESPILSEGHMSEESVESPHHSRLIQACEEPSYPDTGVALQPGQVERDEDDKLSTVLSAADNQAHENILALRMLNHFKNGPGQW